MKILPRTLLTLAVTLLAIIAMLGAIQKANADGPPTPTSSITSQS
ncbi:hypothetical protein GCM10022254_58150 [Actinomadura meridiana]|uniref:Uncharacterized protein n=1 Tax=Actinomadura meridiana TaxID=559626 RepID=A0ABP8CHJ8_9ACTN